MTLDQCFIYAQAEANKAGKPMAILNLNTVGKSLHVVRDYKPSMQEGPYAHQFVAKIEPNATAWKGPDLSDADIIKLAKLQSRINALDTEGERK